MPHDPPDLALLYRRHHQPLLRFCTRLTREKRAAEDLAHEAFARFMARRPDLGPEVNEIAYLQTVARNLYVKGLRSREFPIEPVSEPEDDDLERDPSRSLLLDEQIQQMRRSMRKLNGRQRRAILLREVHNRSYAEIGDRLGINEDAVAQLLSRARARLRAEFRGEMVSTTGLAPACQAIGDDLSIYVDGKLTGARLARLQSHLERCAVCRARLADYREAGMRLRTGVPSTLLGGLFSSGGGLLAVAPVTAVVAAGGLFTAHHVFVADADPSDPPATSSVGTSVPSLSPLLVPLTRAHPKPVKPAATKKKVIVKKGAQRPSSSGGAGKTEAAAGGAVAADVSASTAAVETPAVPTPVVTVPAVTVKLPVSVPVSVPVVSISVTLP